MLNFNGSNLYLHFCLTGRSRVIYYYMVAIHRFTTDVKLIVYLGLLDLCIFIEFTILDYCACVGTYNSRCNNIIIGNNSATYEGYDLCLYNE